MSLTRVTWVNEQGSLTLKQFCKPLAEPPRASFFGHRDTLGGRVSFSQIPSIIRPVAGVVLAPLTRVARVRD